MPIVHDVVIRFGDDDTRHLYRIYDFDIAAVRVQYDGRTYHLVADDDDDIDRAFALVFNHDGRVHDDSTAERLDDACAAWLRARGRYVSGLLATGDECPCAAHDRTPAPAAAVDDNHAATRNAAIDAFLVWHADPVHHFAGWHAARDAHVAALRAAATDEVT